MLKWTPLLFGLVILFGCNQNSSQKILVQTVVDIHKKLDTISADSTYHYLHQAQNLLNKYPAFPDSLRAENSYRLGLYFQKEGIVDSATVYLHRATDLVDNAMISAREVNYFRRAWGQYLSQGRFGDCFTISNRLESLLDKDKDHEWMAWVYFFNEDTNMRIPDYEKALEFNKLRVKAQEQIPNSKMYIHTLILQARLKFYYLKDKKGAFDVLNQLINIKDSLSNNYNRQIFSNYGVYLFREGDYKKSYEFYQKGIGYTKKIPDTLGKKGLLGYAYANLSEVCIKLNEYEEAQAYIDSVKAIGFEHLDEKLQKSVLKYQMRLASLTASDLKLVEDYMNDIYDYQVAQYVKKYNDELVALTVANETEKELLATNQLKEIQNLKLETRFFYLAIGTLFFIVLGYFFYRQRKLNFEKKGLQMQQRLLRSQMNPHFTFNTLSSIQNLVENDQQKAATYLLKFSRQLRLTLENSLRNYVLLGKELSALKEYIDLQLLRFPSKFSYQIVLEGLEEDDPIFIPPMMIQPFIENSIEHGFSSIDYPGKITVILKQQLKFIAVTITDNGSGIDMNRKANKQSASISLISDFLRKATKKSISITHNNELSSRNTGVIVNFLVPFKNSGND